MDRQENIIRLEQLTDASKCHADSSTVDPQRLLDDAEVVYAVSGRDHRDVLVFGKDKLRRIAESEIPEGARVIRVRVGSGPKDLERLLELVRHSKGYHDYAESA